MRKLFLALSVFVASFGCVHAQNKGLFSQTAPYIPVIWYIGQSNGGLDEATRMKGIFGFNEKQPGVKRFLQTYSLNDGGWIDYKTGDYVGSGCIVGKYLHDYLQTEVYMFELWIGGSGLAAGSGGGLDWSPTGSAWANFTSAWTSAKAKISNPNNLPIKVLAIVWHQGEADVTNSTYYNAYSANYATFTTNLRALDPLVATCPLIQVKVDWSAGTGQNIVNQVFIDYAADSVTNHSSFIDPYTPSAYHWRQNEPAGVLSTYPYIFYSDDNHASVYTQVIKANQIWNKLLYYGELGRRKSPLTYAYDESLMSVIAYCSRNSITLPSSNNLTQLNTMIVALKASGAWYKLRILYVPANDVSAAFGSINLVSPDRLNVGFNDCTWTSKQGFTGNGTSKGFFGKSYTATVQPNKIVTYSNLNCSVSMFEYIHSMTSKVAFGYQHSGTTADFYFSGAPGSASVRAFGSTTATPTYTTSNKFFAISRQFSTYPNVSPSFDYYVDASVTTVTDSATPANVGNDISWCRDAVSTPTYGDETSAVVGYGEGLTQTEMLSIRTAAIAYKAAL